MIVIDHILASDALLEDCFVCDLAACKGGCCADGDTGAPLQPEELQQLEQVFPVIRDSLTDKALKVIARKGLYEKSPDFGWVTPSQPDGLCVYGTRGPGGMITCMIEKAFNGGQVSFKKPVTCHLFPLVMRKSRHEPGTLYLNYQPRELLCLKACRQGEELKVPVYVFLKEPLIRHFGQGFYDELEKLAKKPETQTEN